MPNYEDRIENFVLGDGFEVRKKITGLPETATVVKAWLTVKTEKDTDPADATNLIFQKIITAVVGTHGQIVETGAGAGDERYGVVSFAVLPADTFPLDPNLDYVWDIQILLSTGSDAVYTPFMGTMRGLRGVTNKTA